MHATATITQYYYIRLKKVTDLDWAKVRHFVAKIMRVPIVSKLGGGLYIGCAPTGKMDGGKCPICPFARFRGH